ncbi:MAG: hypothetical protein JO323_20470 [Acidobacteriia bacterium]|nr:hypothetical protein [Terriglobia bacterium]
MNLFTERYDVRQTAKRNTFTGKTYNSLDNISQFFGERGICFDPPTRTDNPTPSAKQPGPPNKLPPGAPFPRPSAPPRPGPSKTAVAGPAPYKAARTGSTVDHPKYGRGTVVRREGEGDDAKITVNFPGVGLKKLVEKYAGLKRD